jgi:ADP-heptose:LPS heptosyltransferase
MGDLLSTVPAFRALRAALPDALITLVGLPFASKFVKRFSAYLDDFISFPGFPGLSEQIPDIGRFPEFLIRMQKSNFDLAIQMQNSGEIANSLVRLWGAKRYAGFYTPDEYCPDKSRFLPYPRYEPEAWRHLRLMEYLGIPLQGDELEYPLFEDDWKGFRQIKETFNLQNHYVCIHPGAPSSQRHWFATHFSMLADGLASHGNQIVLIGGEQDASLASSIARKMKAPAINLAGQISPELLAVLISQAHFIVSNNAGVSQIALSVNTPCVDLFSMSGPYRSATQTGKHDKTSKQSTIPTPEEMLDYVETHLKEVHAHVS